MMKTKLDFNFSLKGYSGLNKASLANKSKFYAVFSKGLELAKGTIARANVSRCSLEWAQTAFTNNHERERTKIDHSVQSYSG